MEIKKISFFSDSKYLGSKPKVWLVIMMLAFVFWCSAENFLAAPQKRRSVSQMKQNIVELLAIVVEQESKSIELKAKIQQALFEQVRQLAESDKKSFFSSATRDELAKYIQQLNERKSANEKELLGNRKFLIEVRSKLKK